MSTPVPPARKYQQWGKRAPPRTVWNPLLGRAVKVRHRMQVLTKLGFNPQVLRAGEVHAIGGKNKTRAIVGPTCRLKSCSTKQGVSTCAFTVCSMPTAERVRCRPW